MNFKINIKSILLACLIISIGQLSMGLVMPALPWIAKDFAISLEDAQFLVGVYLLGFGPSQFIYGPISDALGRKRVLLVGLLIAMCGLLVIILQADSFQSMVAGRFIQGLGTGCCAVLARASVRDQFSGAELPMAMSSIMIVASITPLIAPVIGGFINVYFGWQMVFTSLMIYVFIACAVLMLKFQETLTQYKPIPSPKNMLVQYAQLLNSRYFLSFASISWLNFSLMITSVTLMPFIMQNQIGMDSDEYALWALIPALGLLTGATICNRFRVKMGNKKMLLCAPFFHLISALWLLLCPVEPLYLMLGVFWMIVGNGIALPCSQSLVMQPYKEMAGAAAAMSGGGQMIVSAMVSMGLIHLGVTQAWHLGWVILIFSGITLMNIIRGYRCPEIQA